MQVGFLHVGPNNDIPAFMVRSVRENMPDAEIWHMTDEKTEAVPGADFAVRAKYDGKSLMTFRLDHLANLPPGEWLILDTDVVVLRDVRQDFLEGYDVALTKRDLVLAEGDLDVAAYMPFNAGVMFCRNKSFWERSAELCRSYDDNLKQWFGDQLAIAATSEAFCTLGLSCWVHNYTPSSEFEDLSEKAIVHYKGKRKRWLLSRMATLLASERASGTGCAVAT